jgi:hypothetical protein
MGEDRTRWHSAEPALRVTAPALLQQPQEFLTLGGHGWTLGERLEA